MNINRARGDNRLLHIRRVIVLSRAFSGACLLWLLISCASQGDVSGSSIPTEERSSTSAEERAFSRLPDAGPDGNNSAITSLLMAAEQAYAQQQFERAAAHVERAIRIAPANPNAYFLLAQVRFSQAQYGLSKTLLSKARSLTSDVELKKAIDTFARVNKLNR